MLFIQFFSRKWLFPTIIVLIGMSVLIRLGYWQLDRLEQRRSFNQKVTEQIIQPPIDLTSTDPNKALDHMAYREVYVRGEYDFSNQVGLRNQVWNNLYGVHLITPLKITGSNQVVLVDRGWIPAEDMNPENWGKYDESGEVEVRGVIRASQSKPDFGRISDPIPVSGEKLKLWNLVNIPQLNKQMPYDLQSIYITQYPQGTSDSPPYRKEVQLDLTEGPHLGYAIQWFTFSGILLIVYIIYVRRTVNKYKYSGRESTGFKQNSLELMDKGMKKSSGEVIKDAQT